MIVCYVEGEDRIKDSSLQSVIYQQNLSVLPNLKPIINSYDPNLEFNPCHYMV